jgi:hypothetical protein
LSGLNELTANVINVAKTVRVIATTDGDGDINC